MTAAFAMSMSPASHAAKVAGSRSTTDSARHSHRSAVGRDSLQGGGDLINDTFRDF